MNGDGKFTLSGRFIILFRKRRAAAAAAIDPFGEINAHPVCAIDDRGRGNRVWTAVDRGGRGRLYSFSPFAHMRDRINVRVKRCLREIR